MVPSNYPEEQHMTEYQIFPGEQYYRFYFFPSLSAGSCPSVLADCSHKSELCSVARAAQSHSVIFMSMTPCTRAATSVIIRPRRPHAKSVCARRDRASRQRFTSLISRRAPLRVLPVPIHNMRQSTFCLNL